MQELPRLLISLGDVAGIGPEVLLKLWSKPELFAQSQPVVVGDVSWLRKSAHRFGFKGNITEVRDLQTWPAANIEELPCVQGTGCRLKTRSNGQASSCGRAGCLRFLKWAIDHTKGGKQQMLLSLPTSTRRLHLAGLHYPGHTEILAEECGVQKFAMMLYAPISNETTGLRGGVGVAHVTLHQSMRSIFEGISTKSVLDKIELTHDIMSRLLGKKPRIGVCALNPHAGDGGIFGDEEAQLIEPAVRQAGQEGLSVSGPWPSDTLFRRAKGGEFDGIVAMYHDQGHIALKLMSGFHLVNITLGLPPSFAPAWPTVRLTTLLRKTVLILIACWQPSKWLANWFNIQRTSYAKAGLQNRDRQWQPSLHRCFSRWGMVRH